MPYDALLLVSFGGPEKPDDVIPFLENVLRGKNVPRARLLEVAEHYYHFGGKSPINGQNRALLAAIRQELDAHGPKLPVYWGNRNWHPLLEDTLRQMRQDGIRHALAFVTSAYSSYSSCRQYTEDIERARAAVSPGAPEVTKLRAFHNHPLFLEATVARVRDALLEFPEDRRANAALVYTAHSIPLAMAHGCLYVSQLEETAALVSRALGRPDWKLVYQSRSGPPHQPWLEPDICDYLRELRAQGVADALVAPIGFLSDHMEVVYDLDTQAREVALEIGLNMVRAATVGTHPAFVRMIRSFLEEPRADVCPLDCCPFILPAAPRPGARPTV